MVETSLVESDIQSGRTLLDELRKTDSQFSVPHFLVRSAFWLYGPEAFNWRLFIATPLVDQRGPASAYTDVQGVLRSLAKPMSISLKDISVVSPNDKLVKVMKKAAHIPVGESGVRLARTRVDDTYIQDAYVYRLNNGQS
jgi:hypothetical protein